MGRGWGGGMSSGTFNFLFHTTLVEADSQIACQIWFVIVLKAMIQTNITFSNHDNNMTICNV